MRSALGVSRVTSANSPLVSSFLAGSLVTSTMIAAAPRARSSTAPLRPRPDLTTMSRMPDSSFSYPSADGRQIAAYRWETAGEPVGVVQLTHGMGEHAQRYDELASELTRHG